MGGTAGSVPASLAVLTFLGKSSPGALRARGFQRTHPYGLCPGLWRLRRR